MSVTVTEVSSSRTLFNPAFLKAWWAFSSSCIVSQNEVFARQFMVNDRQCLVHFPDDRQPDTAPPPFIHAPTTEEHAQRPLLL